MNKKKVTLLAVAAICLSILSGLTLAYFTAEDTAHNVITTNGVDIQILEWQETDNGLIPYPTDPVAAMPSNTISKIVTVQSNDADAWIRAKAEIIVKDGKGKPVNLPADKANAAITFIGRSAKWIQKEGDSEWWYYSEVVPSGEATEALFESVNFDGESMTNEFQSKTVEVIINTQAVQAKNNPDALGWPET